MIPDWAAIRDTATGLRKKIYGVLCLGWQGTPRQWHRLETAMHVMAIAIVPVAVSVHTIVSWDFAMTPVPMWRSTIFGPYFVVGAIFSGIAGAHPGDGPVAEFPAPRGIPASRFTFRISASCS